MRVELPGFGEVMRMESMKLTKNAILSRALAAVVGGSSAACREVRYPPFSDSGEELFLILGVCILRRLFDMCCVVHFWRVLQVLFTARPQCPRSLWPTT